MVRPERVKLNIVLLRQIQTTICKVPQQFDISSWHHGDVLPEVEKCSSSACLAGWAVVLGTRQRLSTLHRDEIKHLARELLGIRTEEQAKCLFYVGFWPAELATRYIACPRTLLDYQSNALVACARIEAFLDAECRKEMEEAGEE